MADPDALIRAIALWGSRSWSAQEEVQPIFIAEGGAEFAATDTVARGAIVAQHVEDHAADHGQVFRRMVAAGATGILAKLHVQYPVFGVLNGPMAAHGSGESIPI